MYEYTVRGMTCNHCIMAVKKSVEAVDPSATVEVNLATQKVKVESKASRDVIAARIEEAGYPVLAGR
jgi:copper chaperone